MSESFDYEEYHLAKVVNEQVNPNLTERVHWTNTDNAVVKSYDNYATAQYTAKYNSKTKQTTLNKPYTITGHNFELDLPSNAYVKNIRFIVHMKADTGLKALKPIARFNIYGRATTSKYDDTKVNGTGWNSGTYKIYPTTNFTTDWRAMTYTMSEADIIKGGFDVSAFNTSVMGIDLIFNNSTNKVSKNANWTVYLAYIELRVQYDLPRYNITFSSDAKDEDIKVNAPYKVTASFTNPSKANDGETTLDVQLPFGAEIDSYAVSQGTFNPNTLKWTIDSSKNADLTLTLNPMVSGDNTLVISEDAIGTYPHSFFVNRDASGVGATGVVLSTSPNPHKNHRMCVYVDAIGQSETTSSTYTFSNNKTTTGGSWELETADNGVSVASNSGATITLTVPQYTKYTAKLKYCFYPSVTGSNTATVNGKTIDYSVADPYVYLISPIPSENENEAYLSPQEVHIVDHRVSSTVDVYSKYLPSVVNEGDSLMTQSECTLKMYKEQDLDYIGCVPLEHLHFDPKSTFKDTLLDTHYKNKRYMGKKLATDEDITLNVRVHPQQVTTLQGLIEMDKPIPINANHKCFEGDALNHRGWAEIYAIKSEKTNPSWYKCDIDVKYLTHNLNTRFNIEKGIKVSTYEYPSLMAESVSSGTSLEDGYFVVDTDGTFVYNDDEEIQDNIRNILSVTNNQYFTIRSKEILPNSSVVSFDWLATLIGEDRENDIHRVIRLIDSDTNNPVFEYEYTDFEYDDDFINCSLIARNWNGVGWDTSTQSDIALWRDDSILDDDEVDESDNESLFGSTLLFNVTNNQLEVIETGFNGREVSQSFKLYGSGKYYYEIDVRNRNIDAETGAVDFYIDLTVMDTILTSDYAEKYSKLYVSPFPVADKEVVFTRNSEEGTIYYLEDDGEEFTFLINPYYQYMCGTDLKTSDDVSIFSLNYGYEIVYIQNGLVRMGFNRLNGRLYLGKYDPVSKEYVTTHRFHLEKYDDINVNTITDDKIEIQSSDSVFTIWRGHPYIMINHNNEDIWIDTTFNTVWAEKVGGDSPVALPSYWDLMNNSNILPSSVGGRKGIKASDLEIEEQEVTRGSSTLSISSISDGTNTYSSFDDVPFEVGIDYTFTLSGTVPVISEEIPVSLGTYQGDFGTYTISTDSDTTEPYDLTLNSSKAILQNGDTTSLQALLTNYDGGGVASKSVTFYRYNPELYKYQGLSSTSSTDDALYYTWSSGDASLTVGSTYTQFKSLNGSLYVWANVTGTSTSTYDFRYHHLEVDLDVVEVSGTPQLWITTTGSGTSDYKSFIKGLSSNTHIKAVLKDNTMNYYVDGELADSVEWNKSLNLRIGIRVQNTNEYINFKNFIIGGF